MPKKQKDLKREASRRKAHTMTRKRRKNEDLVLLATIIRVPVLLRKKLPPGMPHISSLTSTNSSKKNKTSTLMKTPKRLNA